MYLVTRQHSVHVAIGHEECTSGILHFYLDILDLGQSLCIASDAKKHEFHFIAAQIVIIDRTMM